MDIRHGQHELYLGQRQIRKDIKASRGEPAQLSDRTLSYNTWSKGRVNWADFEDISSAPSSSSARPHGKSAAAHDDDIDEEDEEPEDDADEDDEEDDEDDFNFDE